MVKTNPLPRALFKAFAIYTFAYILAMIAAVAAGNAVRGQHPIIIVLTADIAATLVIYISGRIFRNASFYDAYWSVTPPAFALFWLLGASSGSTVTARQIIVIITVFAWSLRLTYNWARGWQGLKHEDWRYRDLREKFRGRFWLIDLVGIELMPTVIVFLGCLSLYPALAAGNQLFGLLDIIAFIITAGAIVIEATADEQLRRFILNKPRPGDIMTRGLWAFSRHPNYFGEVIFWWGLYFFGLAANLGYWWTIAGPLSVTILFTFVSVPLMEKRSADRRPGYVAQTSHIPTLFPLPPKK
jgi:steroid 5-alpha reductase family enzyme